MSSVSIKTETTASLRRSVRPVAKKSHPPLTGVVAVIGCDGTGKSTLTADLLARLRTVGPIQRRYLGLVSGEMGDKIKKLPLIGPRLEHYLARKARRAQDPRQKLPGVGTAVVMYLLSLWRVRQFRRLLALSRRGVMVITDRYPQAEIPGFHYDGPGLIGTPTKSWLIGKLAARDERFAPAPHRAGIGLGRGQEWNLSEGCEVGSSRFGERTAAIDGDGAAHFPHQPDQAFFPAGGRERPADSAAKLETSPFALTLPLLGQELPEEQDRKQRGDCDQHSDSARKSLAFLPPASETSPPLPQPNRKDAPKRERRDL